MVVGVRNVPGRLRYVSTGLQLGALFGKVMKPGGGVAFLEEVRYWWKALKVYSLTSLQFPLCFMPMDRDVISLFSALTACCHASPTIANSPSETISHSKPFFPESLWLWYFRSWYQKRGIGPSGQRYHYMPRWQVSIIMCKDSHILTWHTTAFCAQ